MGYVSRALWHVNRTNLGWAVKAGVSAWQLKGKLERRKLSQTLPVSTAERAKARDLRKNGFAIVSELIDPAVLEEMSAASHDRLERIEKLETTQKVSLPPVSTALWRPRT